MNVAGVTELLRTRIGLDPQALGSGVLPRVVAGRMRVLGLTDAQHYAARLAGSPEEFDTLTEEVVVPETWFFRGGDVFAHLARHVAAATAESFRVLSAPCSTGEEPYSLVMALTEAGVPCERWSVEAVDLSARALERAKRGCYGETSFRETPAAVRRRYFKQTEDGWALDPAMRSLVRFRRGNLLDTALLAGDGPFDLIFCRNVLIYLDPEARGRVLTNLDRLLAADGLLCMGHAEPWGQLEQRFQATGPSGHFLLRRQRGGERKRPEPGGTGVPPVKRRKTGGTPVPPQLSLPVPTLSPVVSPDLLSLARKQADAGALDTALRNCQAHLSAAGPSPDAYSLLGVIHQARHERTRAADCFRKALYLDPEHAEALLHLMLLHQEDGDDDATARLRRRLGRQSAGGEA